MLSPQLTGVADNASLPFASTLCGACYDACPVAIDIPLMLVHLRSRVVEAKREGHRVPSPEQALMASAAWTMADPGRWGRALRAARVGRLLGGRRRRISTLPPPLAGWTSTRDLPLPPRETFRGVVGTPPRRRDGRRRGRPRRRPGPRGWAMSARDEVLGRVRTALGDAAVPPPVRRDYRTADHGSGMAPAELLDLLVDRLVHYRALVRRGPAAEAGAMVAAALQERGARRVAVPDGVEPAWLERLPERVEPVGDRPPLTAAALDGLDGVLTGCAVAIAETGTIVLDAGPGQGRRALSLVPDYHLVVVTADQVVATVPQALARLDPVRPLTWISGPSATSDIELNRVEGVHGPRTLEVVLCS